MSVITWNVRGLNKTYKQKEIKEFIRGNNKAIITLVEHRVKDQKENAVIKKIAPGWEWVSNSSVNYKRRIWIMWDPRIYTFEPVEIEEQLIHGQVKVIAKAVIFGFSAVYGLHTVKDRLKLWDKMRQIHNIQQGPWIAMGDYNVAVHPQDRLCGTEVQDMETKDFKEYMRDTGMNELQYILEPMVSDHSPLKLVIYQAQGKKNRPFKFFNCITEHPQFMKHIEEAWKDGSTNGRMQKVWNNLKGVKEAIKNLNTQHYKGVDDKIKDLRRELQGIHEEMSSKLQNKELIDKEKELKGELEKLEESIYRQKSRVH
ncbi:uncharacterized protein LOC107762145 [Nicotiana tabacum]|uniref:Uncharacterized protein LOC107762145 n=1 Tax=Nicotiana tabacum TaxID=4097 RepID=A0A1S3X888_TOBAC|nr:PREDICTED: uncharacterized protein LOC107762145 [Nicotiana tabacum]